MTRTRSTAEPDVPAHAGVAPLLYVLMCNRWGVRQGGYPIEGLRHAMHAA